MNIRQEFLRLAWPLAVQGFFHVSFNQIDTIMVSKLGIKAVGACGFVGQFYLIFIMFYVAIAFSLNTLLAQLGGKKNWGEFLGVFNLGAILCVGFGTLGAILFHFFLNFFACWFFMDPEMISLSLQYGAWMSPALWVLSLIFSFETVFRVLSQTKLDMGLKIFGLILNTSLNWIFIFGSPLHLPMGIAGAGLATFLANLTVALIFLLFWIQKQKSLVGSIWLKISWNYFGKIFSFARILLIQDTLWAIGLFMCQKSFSFYNEEVFGVYNLILLVDRMGDFICMAICVATSILIGKFLGKNRWIAAKTISKALVILIWKYSLLLSAIIFLLTMIFYSFYTLTPSQSLLYWQMAAIHLFLYPLKLIGMTYLIGILRAGGDYFASALIEITTLWGYAVPAVLILGGFQLVSPLILYLVWMFEWLFKTILVYWRYKKNKWVQCILKKDSINT